MPVLFVLGIVVFVVVGVFAFLAERRRREALLRWSVDRAWQWVGDEQSLVDFLVGDPFHRGHSRRVRGFMQGTWDGRPALAFDYEYRQTTGSGKNRKTTTYTYGLVAIRLPVALPRVHVGPENVFHKIAAAFGAEDIDVESHAFNSRYRVQADDRRHAFDLLHPRLVELLTQVEPLSWRTDHSSLGPVIVSWWRGRLSPAELDHRLILLDRIVDSVQGYVWREAGWDPDGPAAG